jgi:DNA-directed RNA polymerase subunit RPC12/RpoP
MTKIVYEECPYCKSKDLSYGYQVGDGSLKLGVSGVFSSNIIHTICMECGSIIHSRVEKPEMFRTNAAEQKK